MTEKNYRDGVRDGLIIALKMFERTPFIGATQALAKTAENIENIMDEDGNRLGKAEETK